MKKKEGTQAKKQIYTQQIRKKTQTNTQLKELPDKYTNRWVKIR